MELFIIAIFLLVPLCASIHERKIWNNGACKENGEKWKYFDSDSQGGDGYVAGNIYQWFSWNNFRK